VSNRRLIVWVRSLYIFRAAYYNDLVSDQERAIRQVRSSARDILSSFADKTESLKSAKDDIHQLLRVSQGRFDEKSVLEFLGDEPHYLAIDGTLSQAQQMDVLVFYAGSFGYLGRLEVEADRFLAGPSFGLEEPLTVSTAIPLYEEDVPTVAGELTEGGLEVDSDRLASSLMQLSEYYLALKTLMSDRRVRVVLLDRTLSGDVGHLLWSVADHIRSGPMVLLGRASSSGSVTRFDLELARMLVPNGALKVPAPRSHLLKYAAIAELMSGEKLSAEQLIGRLGANQNRTKKLEQAFLEWNEKHHIFRKEFGGYRLVEGVSDYWKRVIKATLEIANHIFDGHSGHPLKIEKNGKIGWITSADIECLTLFIIYEMIRRAWNENILLIGLIKDSGARELVRTVVPLLSNAGLIRLSGPLPRFNSDKTLLQTNSVINCSDTPTPWRTFEYDIAFRTMTPVPDPKLRRGETRVTGSFRNIISVERLFVKAYVQLWNSDANPEVRSHVFVYDRPCYPNYDRAEEILLYYQDGNTEEKIRPMVHFKADSEMAGLVMGILGSMAKEVIPEALGHNYPLFLADKKAKAVGKQVREAYLGALAVEMARGKTDQQILFSGRFRDYRSSVEAGRRG
jgi:hypothetical protein